MSAVIGNAETSGCEFDNDTVTLLKWLKVQILPVSVPKDIDIPQGIRNIIRSASNSHIFLPVFQRMIYSHADRLEDFYSKDVVAFFKWIDGSSSQMNMLYMIFNFSESDIILLKRSEFSLYQGFIKDIWRDMIELFSAHSSLTGLYLVSKVLMKINLFDELDNLIFQIAKIEIIKKIDEMYGQMPLYDTLNHWVMSELYVSFESLVSFQNTDNFRACLLRITKNALIAQRIKQIYTLVEDYPNSTDTLKEFNICINSDKQKDLLVANFIESLNRRLLLPSIKTVDIILYYIKTIHSFLIIDHRGVLLDKVARPIRRYLSLRNDTVENVVDGLLSTDKHTNKLIELNDELQKNHTKNKNASSFVNIQKRTLNWQPDPVDALPDFQIGKIDDVIDLLTSIFDDDNLFINQFVKIFSVDMLKISNYDISNIMNNLALLKTKFSNNDFNKINIMVNDILQSKSLDTKINKHLAGNYNLHGLFLSHLYWPNISSDIPQFDLPKTINENLAAYGQSYKNFQKGRDLKLYPQYSMANIDVTIDGVITQLTVTLDKLAVLNFFLESNIPVVKLGIIMMKLKMPLQLLKSSLEFWVNKNVLVEFGGGWKINE